jgi:hypothetical protein
LYFLNKLENRYSLLLFLILLILFFKIFIFFDHYPIHDEIISFDKYLEWYKVLLKDSPNNHFLLSFLGMVVKYLFGFNFFLLRLISFLSLILITLYFSKIFKNLYFLFSFFLVILSSDIIFNYSYLFRGYYLSSFLTVIIFNELNSIFIEKKKDSLKLLFFINFLLFIHSLYTIYIILPVFVVIFYELLKIKKIKSHRNDFIIFFLIPTFIITCLNILLTGFTEKYVNNLNIDFILSNFFVVVKDSFLPGFNSLFLNVYVNNGKSILILDNMKVVCLNLLNNHFELFLIFVISLIISIKKLFSKKPSIFDKIIFVFFIFFVILNKDPYTRVFVGIIYFFIFYIFSNFKFIKIFLPKNVKIILILKYFLLIFFLYNLYNVEPNNEYQQLKTEITKINNINTSCENYNKLLSQYETWIFINFYPNRCFYYFDGENNILSSTKVNSLYRKK